MRAKRIELLILSFAWALMAASCGYQLVREKSASLPSEVPNLAVPLARNHTIEAGLEDTLTQELLARFISDGRVAVVAPGRAESELRCDIDGVTTRPVSFTREGRVAAEDVGVTIRCRIVVPGSESVIWKGGPYSASEEYPVGYDYLVNEQAKAAALVEVCRDLSETVRSSILDTF